MFSENRTHPTVPHRETAVSQIEEAKSDLASVRYVGFLTAGVERWKEYREQLADLHKKPLLFVMMNDTKDADDVGGWLRERYPAAKTWRFG